MKLYILIITLFIAKYSFAFDVVSEYKQLQGEYAIAISSGDYLTAIEKSLSLNGLDPSDTNALLYIVFSHKKAGKQIPSWVFEHAWPNATAEDKINYEIAKLLGSGT